MAMLQDEQLRCERECARLCHDFAWSVDHLHYDAFVDLFAPDGIFERAGQRSAGHEAIRAFLNARPTGRVTRHLCSNIRIDMAGPDAATGTCVALMVAGAADDMGKAVSAPLVVDYTDDYVRTHGGWKFSHRRARIVFQP